VTSQVLSLVPTNFARFVCVIQLYGKSSEYHRSNNAKFA